MPAAAVIPAPGTYTKIVAVKTFVIALPSRTARVWREQQLESGNIKIDIHDQFYCYIKHRIQLDGMRSEYARGRGEIR